MNLLKKFLILISFSTLSSCSNRPYEEFVDKHLNEDFSAFSNKCVFVRGRDREHLLILFIDSDISVNKDKGLFIVYVGEKLKRVVKTSSHLMADTANIDKALMQRLALHFLSYNIESLKVDNNGSVFIDLINTEKPELIRFSNENYRTSYYKDGWLKIKGNWYVSIN